MRPPARALLLVAALLAAGGCAMQEDPRMAGIAAEVKTLRRDLAELKAALTPPLAGTSDVVPDFSKPGSLWAFGQGASDASRSVQADIQDLKAKLARVDELAKAVDALKGEMQKK